MKALVTGAAGFIGSHLTAAAARPRRRSDGHRLLHRLLPALHQGDEPGRQRGGPGFRFVEGSLQSADLGALLDGKTHVFHLAAQAGVRKSWGSDFRIYTDNNVDATQRLLEACVGRPLHRFVYASSSSVYGDNVSIPMREDALPQPVSPYGVTKLAAEQLCYLYHANYRVPTTSVRYFTVYGPRQRPDMAFHKFIRAALRGDAITLYGDGEQTRDFTFVDRRRRGDHRGRRSRALGFAYNIGGGSRVSVNQLFEIIARIHGRPLDIQREAAQKGDMRDTFADTTRARADLGFSPKVSLEQGLEAEYRWLASTPALLQ